jgi:hypothetical protein
MFFALFLSFHSPHHGRACLRTSVGSLWKISKLSLPTPYKEPYALFLKPRPGSSTKHRGGIQSSLLARLNHSIN